MGVNTDYGVVENGGLYDASWLEQSTEADSQVLSPLEEFLSEDATASADNYFARTGYDYGANVRANLAANGAPAGNNRLSPEGLNPVPGSDRVSREFKAKVIEIAGRLQIDPNHLMAIMSFESGLDHTIVNPRSNATGLIQFLPSTARNLGTTVEALKQMTPERQLDFVEQYFAPYKGRLDSVEDTYMAVLWPRGIGKDRDYVLFSQNDPDPNIRQAYAGNSGLDANRDGSVTKAEAAAPVLRRLNTAPPADDAEPPTAGQPDRPNTREIQKPPVDTRYQSPNFSERGNTDIDTIILHHTVGDLNSSIGELMRTKPDPNGRSRVSAHYVIDKDGTIYQLVDDKKVAWHAGDVNSRSIGIEIVNRGNGNDPYTEAQYRALEQLVPYLAQKYDVPMNRLLGHSDVSPRGPEPSSNFDWARVRRAVEDAADAVPGDEPPRTEPGNGNQRTYTVRPGDTLSEIAARNNTTWQELARLNGINNPNLIHPGDVLRLPGNNQPGNPPNDNAPRQTYTVRAGDTLSEIAARHGTTVRELARLNNIRNPDFIRVGDTLQLPSRETNNQPPAGRAFDGRYTVRAGDTLSEIAARYNTTWQELARVNRLNNPNLIHPGDTLRVPGAGNNQPANPPNNGAPRSTYTVRAGDTLSEIAAREGTTVRELARLNNISNPDFIRTGQVLQLPGRNGATAPPVDRPEEPAGTGSHTPSGRPVEGRVTSEFGNRISPTTGRRSFHSGIDIAANTGTRVSSTAAGRVAHVGYDADGYGNYIIVDHGNGFRTLYAHLSEVNVRAGQNVSDNQKIGEVGSTGNSTGPHLHYEVRRNGQPVNPRPYL